MSKMALVIVDCQRGLIDSNPYKKEETVKNIKDLIAASRDKNIEVIYVRHDGGEGDDLEMGTDNWQIYKDIEPKFGDMIFEKSYNSAFRETGLKAYLDSKKIKKLILVGLQTEYCFDTTCKVAFEYGYEIIVPEDANTTFDCGDIHAKDIHEYYNHKIWKSRFANVIETKDVIKDELKVNQFGFEMKHQCNE
ncbi:MAG: cysteine hydrolase family protein [Clostridium sp.]